jgi:tetratricopeptide (TPR) repeat protein
VLSISPTRKTSVVTAVGIALALAISPCKDAQAQSPPASAPGGTTVAPPAQIASAAAASELARLRAAAQDSYQALRFESALQQYNQICQCGGATSNDHYWMGETLFHMRRYADAAKCFQTASELDPNADNARQRQVESYLAAKNKEQAKQWALAALQVVKDSYVRNQISVLLKITTAPNPSPPKRSTDKNMLSGRNPGES